MRAALADQQTLDRCPAAGACFTGTPIDIEIILEIATAVHPVNTGAVTADALL